MDNKERKEQLKELVIIQKQKRMEEEEKRKYEYFLEDVNQLFPNGNKEEVEILSKEDSKKI
ncbi:hypothetical protein [Bacillus sp. EB01]|uniref:hypothetical protein n=1 Tax=Bacillus sp. EB01 TaxID=1347086 RepID=UPI0005C6E57B|nr:hypothetical protein [Bacillus sp. EB01]